MCDLFHKVWCYLNQQEAKDLLKNILDKLPKLTDNQQVVFSLPAIYIANAVHQIQGIPNVFIAAQNCHQNTNGAFTGEISAPMYSSVGVNHIVIGHSERREYFAESDALLAEKVNAPLVINNSPIVKSNYAYLVNNTDYNIHQFIYALQSEGVFVQTATRTFSTNINGENKNFGYGSIIISVQQQKVGADELYNIISKASVAANIKVHTVATGYSNSGIDLGSNYIKTLKKPEAAMIIGTGVAASEAGEIWHLLDQRLHMPITKIDILNFSRVRLERYNTLVMVSGAYNFLDKNSVDKIKAWVQNGNTLITIKVWSRLGH